MGDCIPRREPGLKTGCYMLPPTWQISLLMGGFFSYLKMHIWGQRNHFLEAHFLGGGPSFPYYINGRPMYVHSWTETNRAIKL